MSDTPRTDEASRMAFSGEYMVEIEEAQKIERELAEVTKQRDALAEALRNYMSHHRRYGFVTLNEVLDAEQALRATKGGGL
jgi:hypothetical protein